MKPNTKPNPNQEFVAFQDERQASLDNLILPSEVSGVLAMAVIAAMVLAVCLWKIPGLGPVQSIDVSESRHIDILAAFPQQKPAEPQGRLGLASMK